MTDFTERLNLLIDLGKFRAAEALAREAVGRDPERGAGHTQLARAYLGLGDLDAALTAARDGVRYAPRDAWAHDILGFTHARRGDHARALEACNESLRIDPEWAGGYTTRAWVLSLAGRPADALAAADAGLRLDAALWTLHKDRAWALYQLNRPAEAEACATAARGLFPRRPAFPNILGLVEAQRAKRSFTPRGFRHFAAADELFREALRLNPTEPSYHDNRRANAREAGKHLETFVWLALIPFGLLGASLEPGAARSAAAAAASLLFLLVVGLEYPAVVSTMPNLGLNLPRLPLTRRQTLAGRIYWAVFAVTATGLAFGGLLGVATGLRP